MLEPNLQLWPTLCISRYPDPPVRRTDHWFAEELPRLLLLEEHLSRTDLDGNDALQDDGVVVLLPAGT